jgi:hypothetical protein
VLNHNLGRADPGRRERGAQLESGARLAAASIEAGERISGAASMGAGTRISRAASMGAAGITPGGGRGGATITASGRGGTDTRLGLGRERGGSAMAEPCAVLPVDAYNTNIRSSRDMCFPCYL